jgi:mannose-1-phosphate guanylyltransferase
MMTFETNEPRSCGIVETDCYGVVTAFHEKVDNPPSSRANAAVYMLESEVLEWLEQHPEVSDFSTGVLPHFIGRIATWHNSEVHRDIGTLPALRAAQRDPIPEHYWSGHDEWQSKFESLPVFRVVNE